MGCTGGGAGGAVGGVPCAAARQGAARPLQLGLCGRRGGAGDPAGRRCSCICGVSGVRVAMVGHSVHVPSSTGRSRTLICHKAPGRTEYPPALPANCCKVADAGKGAVSIGSWPSCACPAVDESCAQPHQRRPAAAEAHGSIRWWGGGQHQQQEQPQCPDRSCSSSHRCRLCCRQAQQVPANDS